MDNINPDLMVGNKSFLFIEKKGTFSHFLIPSLISVLILPLLTVISLVAIIIVFLLPFLPEDGISPDLTAQFLGQIFGFIILLKTRKFFFRDSGFSGDYESKDHLEITMRIFCQIFLVYFGITLLLNFFLEKLETPENPYASWLPAGNLEDNVVVVILLVLTTIIGAPLFEEYIFRRLLIPALENRGMGHIAASIASSLVFGLIHTPNNLLNGNYTYAITHLVSSSLMGFAAGIVFIITQKYMMAVIIHALYNCIGVMALLISTFPSDIAQLTKFQSMIINIYSIMIFGVFIAGIIFWIQFFIRKKHKNSTIINVLKSKSNSMDITKGFIGFIFIFLFIVTLMNIIEIFILNISLGEIRFILYGLFQILFLLSVLFVARNTKSENEIQNILKQNQNLIE